MLQTLSIISNSDSTSRCGDKTPHKPIDSKRQANQSSQLESNNSSSDLSSRIVRFALELARDAARDSH
ncbi:hypothetical protein PGTUg99_014051 [Puccinia graminis f. sp. tritici]|uniref:Uncharacterized protein n=1 Tax=Puccinia graminis f. sp. tritici TaxID=56615 RepID=A0A5B0QGH6_PUCGR|nr:hypothetical protein PGTUg99_014051 [Puccinia graminis f. sp. tritici]